MHDMPYIIGTSYKPDLHTPFPCWCSSLVSQKISKYYKQYNHSISQFSVYYHLNVKVTKK